MAYVHSFGDCDFTDHDKWMVTDITVDPQNAADFAPGAAIGSIYLVDDRAEGENRTLAVVTLGSYSVCKASINEIKDTIDAAKNAAFSNGALTPIDYSEQLGDEADPEVWEVVWAEWKPSYALVIGGNAVDGILHLRVKQD